MRNICWRQEYGLVLVAQPGSVSAAAPATAPRKILRRSRFTSQIGHIPSSHTAAVAAISARRAARSKHFRSTGGLAWTGPDRPAIDPLPRDGPWSGGRAPG